MATVDRSRLTLSSLDELRQIRADIRLCTSLDQVRHTFERVQEIRRQHLDDFDLQLVIADAQQEIIERARFIRKQLEAFTPEASSTTSLAVEPLSSSSLALTVTRKPTDSEAAEIPPDVPKLDRKSWQLAVGLAVLFTVGILASFFYLIQTARRLNFGDENSATTTPSSKTAAAPTASPVIETPVAQTTVVHNVRPTLRLFTDLSAGTVTVDDDLPKDLSDGELDLDSLTPGTHTVRVESRAGSAAFNFALDGDADVPRVTDVKKSNNAMVVLVSVKDGTGRLSTDATGARVWLDAQPLGNVASDGLLLLDLGKQDHNLEVSQSGDKQKFVLTYTAAPTLTVFVKSDPSTGVLTVSTGEDGVSVFINGIPYKRVTDHGSVRIPLKVGTYRIRVHQNGSPDPPESMVEVKKDAEASIQFHLQPALRYGALQIKGAQPGTVVVIDHQIAATVGADGTAKVVTIQPGDRVIELRHDQQLTKQLARSFSAGQTVTLSGNDTVLDRLAADNKTVIPASPGPAFIPPPQVPQLLPAALPSATGEQVHRGGGFIPYHTPRTPGHYYFQAHAKVGGVIKHSKLQWYAGYQDANNYVLFSLDGKHAEVREVRDGKPFDLGKIPFNLPSDQWVQIEMNVKSDGIQARAKTGSEDWTSLTPVTMADRDFTASSVGMFVPSNEEVAIANFRFSSK